MPQVTTLAEEDVLRAATSEGESGTIRPGFAATGVITVTGTEPGPALDVTVVKGNPSDSELAALLAVLRAAVASAEAASATHPPETWGTPALLHRSGAPLSPYAYTSRPS